jgi:hypothetical protein
MEMESKDPKSTESSEADASAQSKDPKSDATSSETLSDVEGAEQSGGASEAGSDDDDDDTSSVPSPDGAFDEGRGGTNGIEDAGPM